MNTEIVTQNDTKYEVYTDKFFELLDEYVDARLGGEQADFKKQQFMDLLYYIKDKMELPTSDEIEELDKVFNSYVRLCARLSIKPTLFAFALLVNMDSGTFSDWMAGKYRANQQIYSQTAKKWKSVCESFLIDSLANSDTANVNGIFISKAVYGYAETQPVQQAEVKKQLSIENLPDFSDSTKKAEILPDFSKNLK